MPNLFSGGQLEMDIAATGNVASIDYSQSESACTPSDTETASIKKSASAPAPSKLADCSFYSPVLNKV